jgi:hypothetical protein
VWSYRTGWKSTGRQLDDGARLRRLRSSRSRWSSRSTSKGP